MNRYWAVKTGPVVLCFETNRRPVKNKANQISELAHQLNEPIFITTNGEGDMVVMSMAQYGQLQLKLELFSKLAVAQAQKASGDKERTLQQVMKNIRKRLREKA